WLVKNSGQAICRITIAASPQAEICLQILFGVPWLSGLDLLYLPPLAFSCIIFIKYILTIAMYMKRKSILFKPFLKGSFWFEEHNCDELQHLSESTKKTGMILAKAAGTQEKVQITYGQALSL
ncbi:hypothetical protein ACJX0J_035608, partial [Zea mays]